MGAQVRVCGVGGRAGTRGVMAGRTVAQPVRGVHQVAVRLLQLQQVLHYGSRVYAIPQLASPKRTSVCPVRHHSIPRDVVLPGMRIGRAPEGRGTDGAWRVWVAKSGGRTERSCGVRFDNESKGWARRTSNSIKSFFSFCKPCWEDLGAGAGCEARLLRSASLAPALSPWAMLSGVAFAALGAARGSCQGREMWTSSLTLGLARLRSSTCAPTSCLS